MHSTKAPSTRIRFCSKTENFSFGLSYAHTCLVKTVTEYASFRKRFLEWRFLKTLPSSFTCGRTKTTGVFEYNDVKNYFVFHRLKFWCGREKTIRMRYVWTRIISKTDVLRFQKYPDTCGWGSKYVGNLSLK